MAGKRFKKKEVSKLSIVFTKISKAIGTMFYIGLLMTIFVWGIEKYFPEVITAINPYNIIKNADKSIEDIPHTALIELPEPVPTYANLLGVGDNLIHSSIYVQAGRRGTSELAYDFGFSYENISDYIGKADIASLNQETMMAKSFAPSNYPQFNTPTELGDLMVDIGFDVITLANNHMFDKGEKGLQETLDFLREKEDLVVVGAYYGEDDYMDIPIITKDDIDFAFVATTQVTNGLSLPSSSELFAPITSNDNQIIELVEQVKRAEAISDVVVVNIHWGTEYTHKPTEFQVNVANEVVQAGADIILGHHPHVIQPVEYIAKSDGSNAVVCYSLGNFISVQDRGVRMIGGMLNVDFEKLSGKTNITNVEFLPVITHYGSGMSNVTIYPYDKYTTDLANTHGVRSYTSNFSHKFIYDTVTEVIDLEFLPDDFFEHFPYTEEI